MDGGVTDGGPTGELGQYSYRSHLLTYWQLGSVCFAVMLRHSDLQLAGLLAALENVSAVLFGKPSLLACHHWDPVSEAGMLENGILLAWTYPVRVPCSWAPTYPSHRLGSHPRCPHSSRRNEATLVHHSQGTISSFICLHHSWPCLCHPTRVPQAPRALQPCMWAPSELLKPLMWTGNYLQRNHLPAFKETIRSFLNFAVIWVESPLQTRESWVLCRFLCPLLPFITLQ